MKFLVFSDYEKVEPRCQASKCFQIKPKHDITGKRHKYTALRTGYFDKINIT